MTAEAMWPEAPVTNTRIGCSGSIGYDTWCHHHSTACHLVPSSTLKQMSRWKPDARGRLTKAAIELFAEQGYDATTVAEIAARAGLTKRTFFRYFTDKREVLFSGSEELERIWLEALTATPTDTSPLAAVV